MPFESVWGFDPDKAMQSDWVIPGAPETNDSTYSVFEQLAARIPVNVESQVYELRRMYRL